MKHKLFQKPILLMALMIVLFCCYAYKNAHENNGANNNTPTTLINDSAAVTKSITQFLRWYKTNLHKANSYPLLKKDNKGYFTLDAKACTSYLLFLKSSHFLSPKYIGYWQTYFNDKTTMLAKEKIQSDIPEGFDMDFILITQEPELVLYKIAQLKLNIISINKLAAMIDVTLPSDSSIQYKFEMHKNDATWQIDYIATKNFD